jgi:LmbE family N-acetylglucosaminyl deacetylase
MAGGLIATQRARGVEVHVLAVTDGEAAYEVDEPRLLASRRRNEQLAALDELGVAPDAVTRLGLPDGSVAEHLDEMTEAVARCSDVGLVIAPWVGDHHCDHEAVGVAARRGVERSGAALLFGLFWTWHHHRPSDLVDERIIAHELSADAHARRRRALRCHRSQFSTRYGAAQLDEQLVEPVEWPAEYLVAPHPHCATSPVRAGDAATLATGVPPVTSEPSEINT